MPMAVVEKGFVRAVIQDKQAIAVLMRNVVLNLGWVNRGMYWL